MSIELDAFAEFNNAVGFSTPGKDLFTDRPSGISDKTLDALNKIKENGSADRTIDTKPLNAKPDQSKLPEYWKGFEDTLNAKFEFEEEDKTDYSNWAVQNFGQGFAHLNTRDLVYDQAMFANSAEQFLTDNEDYAIIHTILNGQIDDANFLKQTITEQMTKGANKLTVTQRSIQEKIDEYFDENVLNENGKRMVAEIKNGYKAEKGRIETQANKYAADSVNNYKEYRNTFDQELKDFNLFGLDLSDDLKRHLKEYVYAGKGRETPDKPLTNKDRVQREILNAIVSDQKSFLEIMRLIDKRGIDYGTSEKAKSIFK